MALKLSHTGADTWQLCHRKWFWAYEFLGRGLRPMAVDPSLEDGQAIHAGLEALYLGKSDGEIREAIERAYGSADHPQVVWAHALVSEYRDTVLPGETFSVADVEAEFDVPLDSAGDVIWTGRVDLVLEAGAERGVMDHKSVRSISPAAVRKYQHSFQLVGYCYGTSARTYAINFIKRLKTIGPVVGKCPECKGKGCFTCDSTGRVERPGPELFKRLWVEVNEDDIERFLINRRRVAADILAERERFKTSPRDSYPMDEGACWKFGAERPCPFVELCWAGNPRTWYDPPEAKLTQFELKSSRE